MAQLVSNVKYKDEHIAALNHDNKPTNLGLAIINKNEEKVLSNPSNHTVYKEIKKKEIELEIEACFAKGRWSEMETKKEKEKEEAYRIFAKRQEA